MIKILADEKNANKVNVFFSSHENFFAIKEIIAGISGAYYSRECGPHWIMDISSIGNLINDMAKFDDEIVQVDFKLFGNFYKVKDFRDSLIKLGKTLDGVDSGIKLSNGYSLLPFQHIGVEFLCGVRNGILADKVGLGKTLQGFCAAYKLIKSGIAYKCIIVVPSKIRYKWQDEIKQFLGLDAILIKDNKDGRMELFNKWNNDDRYIFCIISYDTFIRDWGSYIKNDLKHNYGIIFDEVQYLKNPGAKRSKFGKEIAGNRLCKFKFGLSATYIELGLQNLFGEMLVIDDSVFGKSYFRFAERYLKLNYFGSVTGYQNVDEIKDKMKYIAIRRHKEQVKEQMDTMLPKVNENTLWVELTKDQKIVYNDVVERVNDKIQDMMKAQKISAANILAQMIYLRQVCLSPKLIGSSVESSIKVDTITELIQELVDENKVVMFSFFQGFIDIIDEKLKALKIKHIAMHGGRVEGKEAEKYRSIFEKDNSIRVLLTSDISKEGCNLVSANYLINADLLWNPAGMQQRMGRLDRLNQKASAIFIVNVWSEKTIEEEMYKVVYKREKLIEYIVDNGYRESRLKKLEFRDYMKMLKKVT